MAAMPRLKRTAMPLALALLVPILLGGCVLYDPPPPTGTPAAGSADLELTPVPGGSTAASPAIVSPPTQTDTEWGRIWDALPPDFPLPPDAVLAETREGPVSASMGVGGAGQPTASFMESALTGAGFSIESTQGPMEDGSITIDAVGPDPACQVQVRVRPLSGLTNVVVLYGAGCPFE
jgi:hypothetical protein